MHALVILSHPEPQSFSAALAHAVVAGVEQEGHTAEIADLAAEGFDPRFNRDDLAAYRRKAADPEDVVREQRRIERADALVFVFPVYWWHMPALLKGWIDRVFSQGWAYDTDANNKTVGLLQPRPVHVLGVAGGSPGGYTRHGYDKAIATQIDHGIFAFSGLKNVTTQLLFEVENGDAALNKAHLDLARAIGTNAFSMATIS